MATMEQRMIVRLHTAIGAERERLLHEPLWDGDVAAADAAARVALRSALDVVDPQADRVQEVAASLRSLAALVESQAIHGLRADVTPEYLRRLAAQLRAEAPTGHGGGPSAGWRDEATGLVSGGLVASCSTCGGPHYSCTSPERAQHWPGTPLVHKSVVAEDAVCGQAVGPEERTSLLWKYVTCKACIKANIAATEPPASEAR
jgi:hypothetical protein